MKTSIWLGTSAHQESVTKLRSALRVTVLQICNSELTSEPPGKIKRLISGASVWYLSIKCSSHFIFSLLNLKLLLFVLGFAMSVPRSNKQLWMCNNSFVISLKESLELSLETTNPM